MMPKSELRKMPSLHVNLNKSCVRFGEKVRSGEKREARRKEEIQKFEVVVWLLQGSIILS
ncbi:hypothetical protein IHE45_12G030900 [Dioscorea alata]|uniref:Uncharacterized protein n=4 Tax=Dioscorea alata TaxID=55571 RepID=A0ACB7V101_DIOAL|nr:hypothetical protein IHE45_12G030900 [Dioscorea alata]